MLVEETICYYPTYKSYDYKGLGLLWAFFSRDIYFYSIFENVKKFGNTIVAQPMSRKIAALCDNKAVVCRR
jgi:hypothetical protein